MKKITVVLALILLMTKCIESGDSNVRKSKVALNRAVGQKISMDVAQRWIERYHATKTKGRDEQFSVSADHLRNLLSRINNQLGVILHHATDGNGAHHVLVVPVKDDLLLWTNGDVLDAATDDFLEEGTANIWAEDYKENNPDGPWSHFFGMDVFDEITSKSGLTRIDLVPAENDDGVPQLLLYVWSGGVSNGRSENENVEVYDISAVCPPTCNGSN